MRARAAVLKDGKYSAIEREVLEAERGIRASLGELAASTRGRFWRDFYARVANSPLTSDARRRLREAVIASRVAGLS